MSEIRINSIKVKNYRSFGEDQEFTFPNKDYKKPIAIVGYNNSGKTNLMRAIKYALYETTNEDTFELNDFHNCKWENAPTFEIKYSRLYPNGEKTHTNTTNVITAEKKISTVSNETDGNLQSSKFNIKKNELIYYINFHNIKEEIITKKTSWGNLTSFLAKHIKKIVDTDNSMAAKQKNYENAVELATDKVLENSQLSTFIDKIKENYSFNLRNNSCEVKFGLPDYEDIFLQMIFKVGLNGDNANLIPIDHFGDGYISMFVMAVIQAIAESNTDDRCLFLFEEPESFLHQNHQEYFYKTVLCNLAEKGHQVIYTTHSDRMVDIFDTKSIIRIEFDEQSKQTVIRYNNVGEFSPTMLLNISRQEIISFANFNSYIKSVEPNLNKILFSRKVVLVEGPNDILAYKIAIEKEVEKAKGHKKYAETYLSFLNIAFVVHHGKATAYLLIELCKHFGLDYFVINDWDFDTDFIANLYVFSDEDTLKQDNLYLKDGADDRSSNTKGMITTNWKLLNSAGIDKIHFNIPKLEAVLGYLLDDKDSLGILNTVQTLASYPETFLPSKLKTFLEFENLIAQTTSVSKTENNELEDELQL